MKIKHNFLIASDPGEKKLFLFFIQPDDNEYFIYGNCQVLLRCHLFFLISFQKYSFLF